METEGGGHPMPLSGLTEGSKSTLVMLPPAPSRVWLASRRPGGTRGRDRCNEVTNLMKMRSWNQEWEISLSQVRGQNRWICSGGLGQRLHLPKLPAGSPRGAACPLKELEKTREKGLSLGHVASQGHASSKKPPGASSDSPIHIPYRA